MLSLFLSVTLFAQVGEPAITETWVSPVVTRRDLVVKTNEEKMSISKQALEVIEVSPEDREKIATAWSGDAAFVWSGTSIGKNSSLLEILLSLAYVEETESTKIDVLNISVPAAEGSLKPDLRMDRLVLMTAHLNPYEVDKVVRAGQEAEAKSFYESAGFAVLENAAGKQCSIPVVGQSYEGHHYVFVGLKSSAESSFPSTFELKGGVFSTAFDIKNPGSASIRVVVTGDLSQGCEWKAKSDVKVSNESIRRISMNYSVFRFVGLELNDPLNSKGQKAYLIRQLPNVRRGLWSGCNASEDKTWQLFAASDTKPALGGRFYIEAVQSGATTEVKTGAMAGAEVKWNLLESSAAFTLYLWSKPTNKKTLSLTPAFKEKEEPFIKWLSKQIPNDPY